MALARSAVMAVQPQVARRLVIAGLAVTMTAATGAAVIAAGWTAASWVAVVIGVAGALEAAALLLLRPSRAVAFAAPPLLYVVTVIVPFVGTAPVAPRSGIPAVLGRVAEAAGTGLLGNGGWDFNLGLGTLLWAAGVWGVEMALSGRRGALATAPCWAILAVNVINSPAPNQAAAASALAAATAILLIAAVQLERLTSVWRRGGLPVLPGTDSRFATAGIAGGALILALALLVPPVTSADISGRLFNFNLGGGGGGAGGTPSGHGGVGAGGTVRFDPATVPGGALRLVSTPVLTYRASNSSGTYLRMATDSVFDSGNWLPAAAGENNAVTTEADRPGPIDRDRAPLDGGIGGRVQPLTVTVLMTDDTSGSNVLPFPGEPDSANVSSHVTGIHLPDSLVSLLTVDSASSDTLLVGRSFTTGGLQSTATTDQLRRAGTSYPSFVDRGGFLQLPPDDSGNLGAIRALAEQWTRNAPTAYDKAAAIENTLRNPQLFHYTLSPPLPDIGRQVWPITYFLTTSHSGYCQYFAASMGTMLRLLGIPTRLVNGYGPGTPPDSAVRASAGATWRVSSNDAHTWVEAYFPGYGWIPFEPTPPSQAGDYQTFARGGAPQPTPGRTPVATSAPATRAPATPSTAASAAAAGSGGGGDGRGAPATLSTTLTVIVAVGTLVALFAIWLLRPRGLPGIWRRIGLVGRIVGMPRGSAMSLHEYAQRVSAALPGDTVRLGHVRGQGPVGPRPLRRRISTALTEIATISDEALYSNRPLHPRERMRMLRAWRRVARMAPAVGWRALLRRSLTP